MARDEALDEKTRIAVEARLPVWLSVVSWLAVTAAVGWCGYATWSEDTAQRVSSATPPALDLTPAQIAGIYARRMQIEQSFRDDKSGGFDLEHTRLQHAQRIDHLLLALALATLWCHELGEFVLKQGEQARCLVDPAHERTLSLFQLGLRWLKRFLATGLHFLPDFQALLSNLKLKPVVIPISLNSNV